MLYIRIKKINIKNKIINDINIDIMDKSLIGVMGEDIRTFIVAFTGDGNMEGDIILDSVSMRADFDEYIKMVSYISDLKRKRMNSNIITVSEFLDLVGLLKTNMGNYVLYKEQKNKLLAYFNIDSYYNKMLNELNDEEFLKLEFLSMFLKKPKLTLVDNFFTIVPYNLINTMCESLKEFVYHGGICIVASSDYDLLCKITNKIYFL